MINSNRSAATFKRPSKSGELADGSEDQSRSDYVAANRSAVLTGRFSHDEIQL